MDEVKKENLEESHKKKKLEHMRENPWIISTFVLGILIVVLLIGSFSGITGKAISKDNIGKQALEFFNTQLSSTPGTLDSVKLVSGLYQININVGGESIPLYFTKDGQWIGQGKDLISILPATDTTDNTQTTPTSANVPKTDKPVVELFIWSYCQYGVQAQGPLSEVVNLLGKYADFEVVLYHDGHGAYETQQNKIQECIQELYLEKYWKYASGFVKDIYPACSSTKTVDCDKTESVKLIKSLGIDSTKVLSCVESKGSNLLSDASALAQSLGVTYSPTLIINGVKVNAARTAEAYKAAVCEAFNNAPEECGTVLSSASGAAPRNC